jgi:hypothetical protein
LAYSKSEKFPFLHERLAKEAHVEEILTEIDLLQKSWLKNKPVNLQLWNILMNQETSGCP